MPNFCCDLYFSKIFFQMPYFFFNCDFLFFLGVLVLVEKNQMCLILIFTYCAQVSAHFIAILWYISNIQFSQVFYGSPFTPTNISERFKFYSDIKFQRTLYFAIKSCKSVQLFLNLERKHSVGSLKVHSLPFHHLQGWHFSCKTTLYQHNICKIIAQSLKNIYTKFTQDWYTIHRSIILFFFFLTEIAKKSRNRIF